MAKNEIFIKKYILANKELLFIKTNTFKNLLFIAIDIDLLVADMNDLLRKAYEEYETTFYVELKKFMPAPFAIPLKDKNKYDTLFFIYKEEDYEHELAKLPTYFWEKEEKQKEHIKNIREAISKLEKSTILTSK